MNKLVDFSFCRVNKYIYPIITLLLAIIPEDFFKIVKIINSLSDITNVIIIRLIFCVLIFIVSNWIYNFYRNHCLKQFPITGDNYSIQIEYGDLFEVSDGKVVINFDECFTTKVGEEPSDIKPESVCGQYLTKHPIANIQEMIDNAGIQPEKKKSYYNKQLKYACGTIVPNGNFLLMAFAKLDENGIGSLTYDDYINGLNTLWEQINLYHGTSDVYIPILGSNITRFDKELTQQELLDIIICSYILSPKRMKKPYTLHIVCRTRKASLLIIFLNC